MRAGSRRSVGLGIAVLVLLAACADDSPQGPDDTAGSARVATTTIATTASPGTTVDAAPATSSVSPRVGDPRVDLETIGEFDGPVDLAVRPGDDALFVVEKPGRVVRVVDGVAAVVLDVTGDVSGGGEQGLLGLAFSPRAALAYVNYTDRDGTTTIAEYAIDDDGTFDVSSRTTVITVEQPYANHNAGDLAFGPDGMLYVPLGDGGSADDPERRASDPTSLLGSLLRIDTEAGEPYAVPADNPFAGGDFAGVDGAPEVWAWGLRNPWRIAFDPVSGALWIADVGQNEIEEINVVEMDGGIVGGRGADFGWSAFEGDERFNDDVADSGSTVFPVLTYRHGDDGCSVSGGVPYRGTAIADLEPAYVYGDYCSGKLWALDLAGGRTITLLDDVGQISAVRAGPDGEIYVLDLAGPVSRLVPAI